MGNVVACSTKNNEAATAASYKLLNVQNQLFDGSMVRDAQPRQIAGDIRIDGT